MSVPRDILAIPRPKNTRVKPSGNHYLVIKRTCKRIDGRNVPVELGVIGEIRDGRYIERAKEPVRREIDIKDYGEVALCDKLGKDLMDDLLKVWTPKEATCLYTIALLRAAYGDIKNRDLELQYQTSFASELYKGVPLSEFTVSKFLDSIGKSYTLIRRFMQNRIESAKGKRIVIDGMLKDYNSTGSVFSEFSRKGAKKGSRDMSLLYAFDPEAMEPIATKPYVGNMLDMTSIDDFVEDYKITSGITVFDKGFPSKAFLDKLEKEKGLSYIAPLKTNSKLVKRYKMDEPDTPLEGYEDGIILCKKVKMANGKFLYSFRDPRMAMEQEVGYIAKAKKSDKFNIEKYNAKKSEFGLIVFESKTDMESILVYRAYAQRWDIEVFFDFYKNIIDRDCENVHNDYRVYATELINFLTALIASRVKRKFSKLGLYKHHSHKELMRYLSKDKMVRMGEDGKWKTCKKLAYIDGIVSMLGI